MDDNRIIWMSLTASGNETATHLMDTPRMTLMFCDFDGDPLIVRTYGTARVIHHRDEDWDEFTSYFGEMAGRRQIFDLTIDLVQTSCGTGVPEMTFVRSRGETELLPFCADMGTDGLKAYWEKKNVVSIDGKSTGIFDN